MAKVLEALIAKGRRVRRPREQKEVAFGLADLSTHEELHERIVKKGGIRSILEILRRSQDAEAQRFSALCIANCASAVFTRVQIVEDGVLEPLIKLIKEDSADLIVRQYCAMAIGNLAAEPDNHDEIVKLDAIDALITLLKASDVESGRYAAFALSNLAANANHREQILSEDAVPALVALACCEDFNVQRQTLSCVRGLCITPAYRVQVVRDGFLDPLVLMARTDDLELLREVAAAFNCLSCMEENKMEIVDRAIANIISMMMCGDPEVERHACCTIANLMEMSELHNRLLEERGVSPLVALS
ncbi:unnamed protein product, partial [Discosporangium mesarthrocarpum]